MLDPEARKDLQGVIQGFATQYDGQGQAGRRVGRVLQPVPVDVAAARQPAHAGRDRADRLHRQLLARRHRGRRAPRRPRRARRQHGHDGGRDRARRTSRFEESLELLPTTLRRANTTFVNLRATLDDLDPLVAASKPATKDLAPFLRDLRPLVAQRDPDGPRPAPGSSRAAGANNDLRRRDAQAARASSASPPRPSTTRGRRCRSPSRCSSSSARTHPSSPAGSTTSARGRPTTTPTATSRASSRCSTRSRSPTTRPAACWRRTASTRSSTASRRTSTKRCPGAASQPTEDGSAPYTDNGNLGPDDCDPSIVLPGP